MMLVVAFFALARRLICCAINSFNYKFSVLYAINLKSGRTLAYKAAKRVDAEHRNERDLDNAHLMMMMR